jgi:hypothetical protein
MLKDLAPRIRRRLNRHRDLEIRVNALESAVVCLCEGSRYEPGELVGFNGQVVRKRLFDDVRKVLEFDVAIETGTWIGDTTGYLATTLKCPVYSCELHRIPHAVAKMRLAHLPALTLEHKDSRSFLRDLTSVVPSTSRCLFYLDAHWHSDLPLAEELRIIAGAWRHYLVIVDDFEVPGDGGYRYDSYGRGKSLSVRDFAGEFDRCGLVPFFPAGASSTETGFKRGCVVLAPRGDWADALRRVPSLIAR